MIATIVDTTALLETIIAALVAGLGVMFTFSLAILGVSGSVEANRNGQRLQAALYVALAVIGTLATIAAIVFGLIVMVS
jgi:ABC-type polysaccharide/polyol phosphate export permease